MNKEKIERIIESIKKENLTLEEKNIFVAIFLRIKKILKFYYRIVLL